MESRTTYSMGRSKEGVESIMPLYDFKCDCCTEVIEINEPIPPACGTCGNLMVRIWSAPAIQFKGSGFYSTGG
jgi:putative FmdB family regulatory protein